MTKKSGLAKFCTICLALVLGMGLSNQARADTITFNPTGGLAVGGYPAGAAGNVTITSFNWGSGDALAVNAISNSGIVGVGSTFQLYYQTKLVALNNSSGAIPTPGLNAANGFQITEIASFTEVVTSLSSNAVTFGLAPTQAANSIVKIYWQDLNAAGATPANADTGSGFNPTGAGSKLIYSATLTSNTSNYTDTTKTGATPGVQTLNPLTPTNYSGITTNQGTGSNVLNMRTLTIDTSFFVAPPGIAISQFSSNLRNNFADIGASAKFNDPGLGIGAVPSLTPNVGANNGTSGPDFLLEVSGATQNFSVPEPASISLALTALGIVPIATWHARRRRARA